MKLWEMIIYLLLYIYFYSIIYNYYDID